MPSQYTIHWENNALSIYSPGYHFDEDIIRNRIVNGTEDIGCPKCDNRIKLSEGVNDLHTQNPSLEQKTWALRTEIEKRTKQVVAEVKNVFAESNSRNDVDQPIRILHLSDLHFDSTVKPDSKLQPLITDLKGVDGILESTLGGSTSGSRASVLGNLGK